MNKSASKISSLALSAMMALSIVGGTATNLNVASAESYDPETRPVVFATDALDGNFNPFFATSGTDTTIAAMTQIGMLTTDEKGNPVCGEDEATVVLDYKETMKQSNGQPTDDGAKAATTEYEFIIKNGIKFSDGVDLTIKDVLFNLYVYLDPAYMGSATIYSTDIVGLQAYRTQDPSASDDTNSNDTSGFYSTAYARVQAMLDCLDSDIKAPMTDDVISDMLLTHKLFCEEVRSDWTMNAGSLESYEEEYSFTEDWEVFYFVEGIVSVKYAYNSNGVYAPVKENGKYVTSLNDEDSPYADEINSKKNDEKLIAEYMAKNDCDRELAQEYIVRDTAINTVIETYVGTEQEIKDGDCNPKMAEVLSYWATGGNVLDEFVAEAKSDYYDSLKGEGGELRVKTISGIETTKTSKDYDGKDLGKEHDVLKITINGVDPKAIWNFAFSVAPMHYYSDAENTAKANGVDYFGVEFANKEFFDEVLQAPAKNGKPVGAGTYMASDEKGSDNPKYTDFYKNNWVYYKRNPYFETVGKGLHNANIKYLRYKVVGTDKILNALASGDIDFGEPNATDSNLKRISEIANLKYKQYQTNGYGYVGVNPKFVPDIEVRQAIMKAMNTSSIITNYYTEALADVIYRPMSITSWAYPKNVKEHEKVAFTRTRSEIETLVEKADWVKNPSDKKYYKDGKKLKLTFTIAGETTDHPAYAMFEDAATFLNSCGFEITVTTDITALKKLATGGLEVWAAAWSSTIDPDMYQVYHKDSSATSVKNWGYPTIFADTTGQFAYEQNIINKLSEKIEEGRETINQDERKEIYAEALDLVMDLCVELPTYQRNDLAVYNANVIATETLNDNPTATAGVVDRLWELNYVGAASLGNSGNNAKDNGGSTGLIIGIVVGVVVLAGAAVAVLFVMKKKKAAAPIIIEDEEETVEEVEEVVEEETSDNE